jgi:uncharacterized metal-binding protein YceD (DUF177 family)
VVVSDSRFVHPRVLKFNIGYLLAQGPGHHRDMPLELPRLRLADDYELESLCGKLRLSRTSRGVLVQGNLETQVLSECVRCLEPTTVTVELVLEELFSYPPSSETPYSVDDTGILDLAPLIREEAILAVPMGVLCRPDCAGLCLECGQNLNEGTCDCEHEDIDSRFAILRQLRQ